MAEIESSKKVCRLCLENDGSISLFTSDDDMPITEKLFACTSLKLVPESTKADKICSMCLCRLREAFIFRSQCLKSHEKISNSALNIKPEIPDTETAEASPDDLQQNWMEFDDKDFYEDNLPLNDFKYRAKEHKTKKHHKKQKKCKKQKNLTKIRKKKVTSNADDNCDTLPQMRNNLNQFLNFNGRNNEVLDENVLKTEVLKKIDADVNEISKKMQNVGDSSLILLIKNEFSSLSDDPTKIKQNGDDQLYGVAEATDIKYPEKKPRKKPGEYFCDICGHCVKVKWDLVQHFRTHTGERPFKCEVCGKRFAYRAGLTAHSFLHGGSKPFVCDVCGKGLGSRETLAAHARLHSGELPFTCPVCGRAFRAVANLRSHRRIHTGVKTHSCPVCSKMFYTGSEMREHARRHSGERPYACSLCPQRFTGRGNQRLHMKIHTGQRDFKCQRCPKTFVSRDSMHRHERTHSGEQAFQCSECGRKFTHRSSLVSHRGIHSKTKDHVCNICNQRFGYPSGLYVHRKKKHNIQPTRLITPAVVQD